MATNPVVELDLTGGSNPPVGIDLTGGNDTTYYPPTPSQESNTPQDSVTVTPSNPPVATSVVTSPTLPTPQTPPPPSSTVNSPLAMFETQTQLHLIPVYNPPPPYAPTPEGQIAYLAPTIERQQAAVRAYDPYISTGVFVGTEPQYRDYSRIVAEANLSVNQYNYAVGAYNKGLSPEPIDTRIYQRYTASDAPLSFRVQDAISKAAGLVMSPTVLETQIRATLFPSIESKSDATKAQYNYEESVRQVQKGTTLDKVLYPAQSYALQNIALGYGVGFGAKVGITALRLGATETAIRTVESVPIISKIAGGISKYAEPIVNYGGLALYSADVGSRILAEPDFESKVVRTATIGIGEATPGLLGASTGWESAGSVISRIQTRGLTDIPLGKITPEEIISGKETFPTPAKGETIPESLAKYSTESAFNREYGLPIEYTQSKYAGYHSTPERLVSGKIESGVERPTDVSGLYTAPAASPYFTRVYGSSESPGLLRSLFESSPLRPQIYRVYFEEAGRLPKSVRSEMISGKEASAMPAGMRTRYQKAEQFLRTNAKLGKGYITPAAEAGKPELELVMTPGSKISDVGTTYRTTVDETKVPIRGIRIESTGEKEPILKKELTKSISTEEFKITEELYNRGRPVPYHGGLLINTPKQSTKPEHVTSQISTKSDIISVKSDNYKLKKTQIVDSATPNYREPSSSRATQKDYVKPTQEKYDVLSESYTPETLKKSSYVRIVESPKSILSPSESLRGSESLYQKEPRHSILEAPRSRIPKYPETPKYHQPSTPYAPKIPKYPASDIPDKPYYPKVPRSPTPTKSKTPSNPILPGTPTPIKPSKPKTPLTPIPSAPRLSLFPKSEKRKSMESDQDGTKPKHTKYGGVKSKRETPWHPAALEYVTTEEFQTGKLARHVRPKGVTQELYRQYATTGRPIPTALQLKKRGGIYG